MVLGGTVQRQKAIKNDKFFRTKINQSKAHPHIYQ
jgi:hypothetical protein